MNKILKSKLVAWLALSLVITLLGITFSLRVEWWCFFDIFFFFMMAFCHLLAISLIKMSPIACKKLNNASLVFLILGIISLIGEWFALNI